jgi:hypothetical protein
VLKKLRTYLGRVIRDVCRKIEGNSALEAAFTKLLALARRVRDQKQHQRGPKVYSLHAPEVECIGKGKAHRPYEFGVKVSVATTIGHAKGGQFVTHVKALPGNPYDGHTLATVIPDMEALIGNIIARILADKGYRGHNAPTATDSLANRSQRNEADARAAYRVLQDKLPAVLGSRAVLIKRADLGDKGAFYRAMVGPFATPDEAF